MSILAVIPARGGSKRLPRKNIRYFAGKPLLAWTIEASLKTMAIDRVIVSTDDEEIAEVALAFGAEVPFLRPDYLAQDDTSGISPVIHALEMLPGYDQVLLLQPTSPLRTVKDINGIITFCREIQAPAAVSVTQINENPLWMYRLASDYSIQPFLGESKISIAEEDKSSLYLPNGALYLANVAWFREQKNFFSNETVGYVMPQYRSVDIDTQIDWDWAEFLINKERH